MDNLHAAVVVDAIVKHSGRHLVYVRRCDLEALVVAATAVWTELFDATVMHSAWNLLNVRHVTTV